MTNFESLERFDQAHGAKVEKLIWIAAVFGDNQLDDFFQEMEKKQFNKCFPEIPNSINYNNHDELSDALVDFKKFGLLAEINIPRADNFSYKDGKPISWSIHQGVCRVEYVYAETLEGLMSEIEKVAENVFQEYIKKDKKQIESE